MARKVRTAASGQTVLVVDDQEEVLVSVRAVLEHAGYRVVTAQSAAAALTEMARGGIDLVLVDLVMQGMPGDQLIRRIRTVDAAVPIVLHTGSASERPPAELVVELGIQGYHQKADGPEQLLLWVASALGAPDPAERLRARAAGQHELIAQVSHGLRTPLQQIGGYTDLLLDGSYGDLPEAARAPLLSLARSGHDLTRLLTNVLTHTRLAACGLEVEKRRVAVNELAAHLRSVAETLLVGRPVRFAVEVQDAPAALRTDPQAVRAILINLLDNAAKFTASGLITLSIVREGSAARLTIADTGAGIAPDDLAHLFQPFQFGAGSVGRGGAGLGLGLAVSRQLAELLGGELSAQSQPGVGSVFSLLLRGVVPNGDASSHFRPWPDDTPGEGVEPDGSRAG